MPINLSDLEIHAGEIIQRYEYPKAAMLPLLWLVQQKQGYVSAEAEAWVGRLIGVSIAHVREVVSFYNMFHTKPVGRRELRVCTSLPCVLQGAGELLERIKERLKISPGETTPDKQVTLSEVECLCACEMAPMAQLDERFIGPLEGDAIDTLINDALTEPGKPESTAEPKPFICYYGPVLSTRFKNPEGMWLEDYIADSGYVAARKALTSMTPEQITDEVNRRKWLGNNIQGTGFDLDVVIHRGAGAYICGEETALLTSLEGGKGFPRIKPPFPAISGLFASPTIVNNVETLACIPFILRNGAERFAAIGSENQGGTRLFSVCGHVARPGLYEEPVGVTLRDLIRRAGGVRNGRKLKAVVPGGLSAKILRADEIDVAMDFNSLAAA